MIVKMTEETFGQTLKRLMDARKMSRKELERRSGIDYSYLYRLERDKAGGVTKRLIEKLSAALNVSTDEFMRSKTVTEIPPKPLKTILGELQKKYEQLEVVEVPVRGYICAGLPCPEEETDLGPFPVTKGDLSWVSDAGQVYALIVKGDSLAGLGIHDGDQVLVDPGQTTVINGKLYVCEVENKCVARRVYFENGFVRLTAANDKYEELRPDQVEIKGRIIAYGSGWHRV